LFYNRFDNMTDAIASEEPLQPGDDPTARSAGHAWGLELGFSGSVTDHLSAQASYTLSRSVRERDGTLVLSQVDRSHVLNVALDYDFGSGYRLGARWLFYTGTPSSPERDAQGEPGAPERSRERSAPFHRLDVRFEKRWDLQQGRWLALVVEGLNVTLSKEEVSQDELVGPITIPSLGIEASF
jgi:hypothetical protein